MGRTQRAGRLPGCSRAGSCRAEAAPSRAAPRCTLRAAHQAASPEVARQSTASRSACGLPAASSVKSNDSGGFCLETCVAPSSRASSSRFSCGSTAKIVAQPGDAARPSPRRGRPGPRRSTAIELPGCGLSTLSTAPAPVFTPQANAAASSSGRSSGTLPRCLPSRACASRRTTAGRTRRRRGRAPAEGLAAVRAAVR